MVRGDWVKHNIFKNEKDYLFCVKKQSKDGFYFEAKARSLHSGDFYDVRFEGKKKYLFFIFKNHQWHVYFMENDLHYHPSVFKSAEDLLRLESDIQSGRAQPDRFVYGAKVKKFRSRGGARIDLPDLPFLFRSEANTLRSLHSDFLKGRYQYTAAPKYLVAARKTKYANPESANSLYLFGCNKDSVYKNISSGVPICVTHTYENEKAVAVLKDKNRYDIIPLQHCLSVL